MATTTIKISVVGNSIVIDHYAPVLSISRNDKVRWKGDPASLKFLVCFGDRTPFASKHFDKVHCDSGPIQNPLPDANEYFKYSVEAQGITLDPGVVVKP